MFSELFTHHYGILTSLMTLFINSLLIVMVEPLVQMIGLHYKTNESVLISTSIFICLLLNSCILPLLLQANFSADYPGSIMDKTFSFGGRNSDFSANWYKDIGPQLHLNLFFLALMPVFMIVGEWVSLKIVRFYKKKVSYRGQANNMTDNMKFLELNAGPEYNFVKKTGSLNCVLFMTLIFGTIFPGFYLIALIGIGVQYVVERYSIACFYRLPTKFSLLLT